MYLTLDYFAGIIRTHLQGHGRGKILFSNCHPTGWVAFYLGNRLMDVAEPYEEKEIEFNFDDGVELKFRFFAGIIHLIDFQVIDCYDSYINCGKMIPDSIIANNTLKIRFSSHGKGLGFAIHFKTMWMTEQSNLPSEDMWNLDYVSNQQIWQCSKDIQEYNIRNESMGLLLSPNYPQDYENNTNCIWKLQMPEESQFIIYFWSFNIEVCK